ncbi:hypothetical protein COW46_00455 [Candidatus Gracilibacteria bacterium CG17_big_fil_post_rev_8_21_14_2_50_48_13]|nr:MAG: hypothetical protein COW46_00455 [Candidatus Gracilibacteria bacterium CG17_big_fil_post_rev_8_21_14_2_50_48_13]
MPPKKRSKVDRLIKGIIIGGAIGSVVGVTLAPKSGKETRDHVKNSAKNFLASAQKKGEKKVKKGPVGTLLGGVHTLVFGKKKRGTPRPFSVISFFSSSSA